VKIEIIAEDTPRHRLWRVRWEHKEAIRKHLLSALVRAWWRNRIYIASCANATGHGRGLSAYPAPDCSVEGQA
jgi:hypothetical protein